MKRAFALPGIAFVLLSAGSVLAAERTINRICDLVERIAKIAEQAILSEGGRKEERGARSFT